MPCWLPPSNGCYIILTQYIVADKCYFVIDKISLLFIGRYWQYITVRRQYTTHGFLRCGNRMISKPCQYLAVFVWHEIYKCVMILKFSDSRDLKTNLCEKYLTLTSIHLAVGYKISFVFNFKVIYTKSLVWANLWSCVPMAYNYMVMWTDSILWYRYAVFGKSCVMQVTFGDEVPLV